MNEINEIKTLTLDEVEALHEQGMELEINDGKVESTLTTAEIAAIVEQVKAMSIEEQCQAARGLKNMVVWNELFRRFFDMDGKLKNAYTGLKAEVTVESLIRR